MPWLPRDLHSLPDTRGALNSRCLRRRIQNGTHQAHRERNLEEQSMKGDGKAKQNATGTINFLVVRENVAITKQRRRYKKTTPEFSGFKNSEIKELLEGMEDKN